MEAMKVWLMWNAAHILILVINFVRWHHSCLPSGQTFKAATRFLTKYLHRDQSLTFTNLSPIQPLPKIIYVKASTFCLVQTEHRLVPFSSGTSDACVWCVCVAHTAICISRMRFESFHDSSLIRVMIRTA